MAANMFDLLSGEDDPGSEHEVTSTDEPEQSSSSTIPQCDHQSVWASASLPMTARAAPANVEAVSCANSSGFQVVNERKRRSGGRKQRPEHMTAEQSLNTGRTPGMQQKKWKKQSLTQSANHAKLSGTATSSDASSSRIANQSKARALPAQAPPARGPSNFSNNKPSDTSTIGEQLAVTILSSPLKSTDTIRQALQLQVSPSHKPRYVTPKLPLQRLSDEPNVKATNEWRAGKPPSHTYRLPKNFDPRINNKNVVTNRSGRVFPMFDHIAAKTGTHIMPIVSHREKNQTSVHIWGTAEAAQEAVRHIEFWIWQSFPSRLHTKVFPKIPSLSYDEMWEIEVEARQEAYRQRFRQPLPDAVRFFERRYVTLPDVSWSLTELLGSRFEALDAIRTKYFCYITYVGYLPAPVARRAFEVLGNDASYVERACQCLYGIVLQQDARQLDRPQWWMVKPCKPLALQQFVQFEPYREPSSIALPNDGSPKIEASRLDYTTVRPRFAGTSLSETKIRERASRLEELKRDVVVIGCNGAEHLNLRSLQATTTTLLRTLTYYRGYMRMRASLGQCMFTTYPRENGKAKLWYGLDEFEDVLRSRNREESPLDGRLTEELGDAVLEDCILRRFQNSSDFLIPCTTGSSGSASDQAVYCATLVIADQTLDNVYYLVELEFQARDHEQGYERTKVHWLRLDQGETGMTSLMDINIVDLTGKPSQKLSIIAANAVDGSRLPDHYHEFVNDITVRGEIAADPKDARNFFRWPVRSDGNSTVPLVSLQQKRAWRFTFLNADYVVEVATLQKVAWPGRNEQCIPYEMRWGVSMWHEHWDMWLPENAHLGLGEMARWSPEESFMFPSDRDYCQPSAAISGTGKGKISTEEAEDQAAESMLFHAGTGFKAFMDKLRCVENVVLGRIAHGEAQDYVDAERKGQLLDSSTDDGSDSE